MLQGGEGKELTTLDLSNLEDTSSSFVGVLLLIALRAGPDSSLCDLLDSLLLYASFGVKCLMVVVVRLFFLAWLLLAKWAGTWMYEAYLALPNLEQLATCCVRSTDSSTWGTQT